MSELKSVELLPYYMLTALFLVLDLMILADLVSLETPPIPPPVNGEYFVIICDSGINTISSSIFFEYGATCGTLSIMPKTVIQSYILIHPFLIGIVSSHLFKVRNHRLIRLFNLVVFQITITAIYVIIIYRSAIANDYTFWDFYNQFYPFFILPVLTHFIIMSFTLYITNKDKLSVLVRGFVQLRGPTKRTHSIRGSVVILGILGMVHIYGVFFNFFVSEHTGLSYQFLLIFLILSVLGFIWWAIGIVSGFFGGVEPDS